MSYRLDFTKQALEDIDFHKRSGNKAILKKMLTLLEEIAKNPQVGTGRPEPLKYELTGYWSRRINIEHRLIYSVDGDNVIVLSAKGHYLL